jgi:hypothetical protein
LALIRAATSSSHVRYLAGRSSGIGISFFEGAAASRKQAASAERTVR